MARDLAFSIVVEVKTRSFSWAVASEGVSTIALK